MGAIVNESERVLVRRALAGDGRAFQRLVELHHERVYRAALAVVADHADALDVTQETWIKAWRGLAGFRGEAALGTWLTRLAQNAATDHLRRQRARRAAAERASGAPLFATPLDGVEDREAWRQALGGLPAAQRHLVRLRHERDLRVDEIAVVLGIPVGTVKSRLHAAVAALRSWLGDRSGDGRGDPDRGSAPGAAGADPQPARPGGTVGPALRSPDQAPSGGGRESAGMDAARDGATPSRARPSRSGPARPDRARALRSRRHQRPPLPTSPARPEAATPSGAARARRIACRVVSPAASGAEQQQLIAVGAW